MNKYLKSFLHRGLLFGGFGPVVASIVFLAISHSVDNFTLSAQEVLTVTLSTYLLAFVHAGASIFNQIEHWPLPKSLLCHFSMLYAAYSLCYIANSWIPFEPKVLLIFSLIFIAVYFVIWITVYLCVRNTTKKLNGRLG